MRSATRPDHALGAAVLSLALCGAAAVAAFAFAGSVGTAAAAAPPTADCSRPTDGGRSTVECSITLPGVADGRRYTYAFVRTGCYHPGSAVVRGGQLVVRRNDIGNGKWHISIAPKPGGKGVKPLRFAFRVTGR